MLRHTLLTLCITASLVACSAKENEAKMAGDKANPVSENLTLVTQEDLLVMRNNDLTSGPVVTGTVQPERRADLRAELSSVVLQVLKENGERVKKGDLLVRLDDTSIRDSLRSSDEGARVSAHALDQADRQLQRMKRLQGSGLASTQEIEDVEIRHNNAQSDLASAKSRLVQARQQLERTLVRAPFDGITFDRKVSAGDTAQIGKEFIKVIDPSSNYLQGFVSADAASSVKPGQSVSLQINGYHNQKFIGKVKHIDPAASAATRQVEVLVEFADKNQPKVAGMYAEGRIEAGSAPSLMIRSSALVHEGEKTYAWRIENGMLNKVSLVIGERDPRRGDYVVRSGLTEGDKIIRRPISTLRTGQKIVMTTTTPLPI